MSMLTDLFGNFIYAMPLEQMKENIKNLPNSRKEQRAFLLREYAALTNKSLAEKDFLDINA